MKRSDHAFHLGLLLAVVLLLPLSPPARGAETKIDVSKLPPVGTAKVDFDKDLKPILEKSCVKCHGPEKPKSKYRVDSKESLIKGGDSEEAAVIPGKSDQSPLVHYTSWLVEDMEMPPKDKTDKYPQLTPQQIGMIRAWIDQGAK